MAFSDKLIDVFQGLGLVSQCLTHIAIFLEMPYFVFFVPFCVFLLFCVVFVFCAGFIIDALVVKPAG